MKLNDKAYGAIYEREGEHWWYLGRQAVLTEVLAKTDLPARADILDVGCGTGGNLSFLKAYGSVDGCDYAEEALRFCAKRGFHDVKLADICDLPYADDSYDLVTCLDVIEHIRLDTLAFSELARVVRPGGHILITLPVSPRLYTSFDCLCGHLRRYTYKQVRQLAEANRLELRRLSCYVALNHPATRYYMHKGDFIRGKGQFKEQMETTIPGSNALLTAVFRLEARLIRYIDFPWGSSLFAVFKRGVRP